MNKKEFLSKLQNRLSHLPNYEMVDIINYYDELIEDRVDNSLKSEEEVVNELGSIDDIVKKLGKDNNSKIVYDENTKQPVKQNDDSKTIMNIIIFVLLLPVWITAFSVLIGCVVGVISAGVGIFCSGIGSIIMSLTLNNITMTIFWIGIGLLLIGVSLVLIPPIVKLINLLISLMKKFLKFIINDSKRRLANEN